MRTLLGALARRGCPASALQAMVFDSPSAAQEAAQVVKIKDPSQIVRIERHGVEHFVVPTKNGARELMTSDEEERFLHFFNWLIDERRPDALLTWSGRLLERTLRTEARRRGIPVVFYLANDTYRRADTFEDVDLVVTDSQATAALYKERLDLEVRCLGKFIDVDSVRAPTRTPKYVTFVSPLPEKGVSLFATLARRARSELPEAEFLVVEGRGSWSHAVQFLALDPRDFGNVYVSAGRTDMRPVYANTRVLLVPSFWHESGARVIPEALSNGIPILGSRRGGTSELMAGSGYTFDVPEDLRSNWTAVTRDEVVTPWLDVLKRLVRDEAFYADESRKAREAAARHDVDKSVSRFLDEVTPLIAAKTGAARPIVRPALPSPRMPGPGTKPSFLFACPGNLLDRSSGAALGMRTLLHALAARGFGARAVQATIFDSPAGAEEAARSIEVGERNRIVRIEDRGAEHFVMPTNESALGLMNADEQETFLAFFRHLVEERRPDVVLTWGGRILERALRAEARRKGLPVVFAVSNGEYYRADTFADADLVVTFSRATAALYRERFGREVRAVGNLVELARCKAAVRTPKYITFMNPLPAKGIAMVAALARRARTELPEAEFLIVESRGTWAGAAEMLHLDANEFPNVYVSSMRADLRPVYANTRVLLVPSLWHETGPRIVPEALVNGIPVLGSRSGGIPENLAGSGYTFEIPDVVQANWTTLAPDDAVTPWLAVLKRLLRDETFYAEESLKALEAAKLHDLDRNVTRFLDAVSPLLPAR